jgi:hypothetical protein
VLRTTGKKGATMEKDGNNFPDEAFVDLFAGTGRCSIAPRIVAVVMVLQRYCGMSDREAVDAFVFDARWKYAAGLLDFDPPGFVHTANVPRRFPTPVSRRYRRKTPAT